MADDREWQKNDGVPVLYVDGLYSVQATGEVVKIGVFQDVGEPGTNTVKRQLVARLVMPLTTAEAIAAWLPEQVANIKEAVGAAKAEVKK